MGKNAKKKMYRQFGGDTSHTARLVKARQDRLSEWIASKGGAEKVHLSHLSCLTAAKPRRKGVITAPDNPYRGSYISDMGGYYFLSLSTTTPKRGEREALKQLTPKFGGFAYTLNGVRGYVVPSSGNGELIRQLQVKWGV